jgi:hypothetical protein
MSSLAQVMLWVFVAAWFVALGAWIYAARYFLPWWSARFRGVERPSGHLNKALRGAIIFTLAWAVGFAAGLVAEFWGGGWG